MVPLLGLTLAFLAPQASETYVCNNIRPSKALAALYGAREKNVRVQSIAKGEGMLTQVEADADDASRTIRLRGDRTEVAQAISFLQMIDNQRVSLHGSVRIKSPVDGVDAKVEASLRSNVPFDIKENESDVRLSITPRPNADGTCTIYLVAGRGVNNGEMVTRVRMGEIIRVYLSPVMGLSVTTAKAPMPQGDTVLVEVTINPPKTKA